MFASVSLRLFLCLRCSSEDAASSYGTYSTAHTAAVGSSVPLPALDHEGEGRPGKGAHQPKWVAIEVCRTIQSSEQCHPFCPRPSSLLESRLPCFLTLPIFGLGGGGWHVGWWSGKEEDKDEDELGGQAPRQRAENRLARPDPAAATGASAAALLFFPFSF